MPPVATLRPALHLLSTPSPIATGILTLVLAVAAAPAFALDDFQADPLPMTPVIGISPSTITFSRCLTPNSQCQSRDIDLFNNVPDPTSMLEITDIQISGAGFTVLGPQPPFSIPGDGTRVEFTIRFCPVNGDPTPGTLIFTSPNANNSPFVFAFEGDGNEAPVCDAGGPYSGAQGAPVSFDGTASHDPDGSINLYAWDFGDGTSGSGATPTHTYPNGGNFNVLLRVRDNCSLSRTCSTTVSVTGNLAPICDPGGPYTGHVGTPIQFDGTGSSDPDGTIASYSWDFRDGTTATGPTPTHTYTTPGGRNVRLILTDNQGAQSQCTILCTVGTGMPVCDAGGPYLQLVNANVHFDASDSFDPNGAIVNYSWEFGDGTFGNGPTATHAYSIVADYTVRLCVEDVQGMVSCCLTTARIRGEPSGFTPVIGVSPQTLDFGCAEIGGSVERTIAVFNNVADPSTILHLTDAAITAADFELVGGPTLPVDIPGDGSDVTFTVRFTPSDTELTVGSVRFTASNAGNSPVDVFLRGRGNTTPLCDAGGPYSGPTGQNILFDGSGSSDPGGTFLSHHWDFGDGSTGTGVSVFHRYLTAGTFQVVLTVTDNCNAASSCTTTASISAELFCDAGGPYFGAVNFPLQFDGRGSGDPGGFIVAYNWAFGDGSTGTGPTPVHTYTTAGSFTVELEVIDNDNNSETCTTTASITIITPVEISAFQAVPRPSAVDVSWRFRSDGDFLGFELRRQLDTAKPELELHDGLLTDDDRDGSITFTDTRVRPGDSYDYWLVAVERNGERERFGPLHVEVPMPEIALRIVPNPSRPPISVTADLPQAGPVRVWVADATGRIVRTITEGQRSAGSHALTWDGRDGRGVGVASGIYFTVLEQGNDVLRQKLVLVR